MFGFNESKSTLRVPSLSIKTLLTFAAYFVLGLTSSIPAYCFVNTFPASLETTPVAIWEYVSNRFSSVTPILSNVL